MDYWIYRLYIWHMGIGLRIAALWNPKAKKWVDGRRNVWQELKSFKNEYKKDPIWCHASSLGELEQVYPILQKLNSRGETIVVSFFSPSGYEYAEKYKAIDFYFYLPIDTIANATRLVESIKPKKVIWVKYDFWFHTLQALKHHGIPLFLVAATFTKKHFLLQPSRAKLRKQLHFFSKIFVQDEASKDILSKFDITHVTNSGDTRIDRVMQRETKNEVESFVESYKKEQPLIVFASVHASEFMMMIDFIKANKQYRYIVAPHNIDTRTLESITKKIASTLYTQQVFPDNNVLILDTMGDLFSCYKAADLIYIGGGFDKGIHNTLEPAVFGKKIIIGPDYHHFPEAVALVDQGLIHSIRTKEALVESIHLMMAKDPKAHSEGMKVFFQKHSGAVEAIMLSLTT